jgi:hypothetical protein
MCPSGYSPSVDTMPNKGVSDSWRSLSATPKPKSVRGKVTLMLLLLSTNTFFTLISWITGSTRSGYLPGWSKLSHWSAWVKVIGYSDYRKGAGAMVVSTSIYRSLSFWCLLFSCDPCPPKMTLTSPSTRGNASPPPLPVVEATGARQALLMVGEVVEAGTVHHS